MRCHKCDEGVLQIESINSPEPGWFAQCNRCHYHTRFPTADQMVTAQPMTAPTRLHFEFVYDSKEDEE